MNGSVVIFFDVSRRLNSFPDRSEMTVFLASLEPDKEKKETLVVVVVVVDAVALLLSLEIRPSSTCTS